MRIKWLSENIGTGLEGVEAKIGEVIDHPLEEAARMLIDRGHAEETNEPASSVDTNYETPSGRLTDVDGIGQVTAAQLARAGIATLHALAEAAVSDVEKAAGGKSAKQVQAWIHEARQLLDGKEDASGTAASAKQDAE